eukprot:m.394487 g.394487  ORF g.394487 m.394487 type:complete len:306 (+) comp28345_c0_seq3:4571-5488(+)
MPLTISLVMFAFGDLKTATKYSSSKQVMYVTSPTPALRNCPHSVYSSSFEMLPTQPLGEPTLAPAVICSLFPPEYISLPPSPIQVLLTTMPSIAYREPMIPRVAVAKQVGSRVEPAILDRAVEGSPPHARSVVPLPPQVVFAVEQSRNVAPRADAVDEPHVVPRGVTMTLSVAGSNPVPGRQMASVVVLSVRTSVDESSVRLGIAPCAWASWTVPPSGLKMASTATNHAATPTTLSWSIVRRIPSPPLVSNFESGTRRRWLIFVRRRRAMRVNVSHPNEKDRSSWRPTNLHAARRLSRSSSSHSD